MGRTGSARRWGLLLAYVVATVAAALVGAEARGAYGGSVPTGLGADPTAAIPAFAALHLPLRRIPRVLALAAGVVFLTGLGWTGDERDALAAAVAATANAIVVVAVLLYFGAGRRTQRSLAGTLWLVVAVLAGAAVGGTLETGLVGRAPTYVAWAGRGLGQGLGVMTTLPFMLAWRRPPSLALGSIGRSLEALSLGSLWALFVALVATGQSSQHPETLLLLVPLFTWTAARFGIAWGALGNLLFVLFVHDTGVLEAAGPTWVVHQRGLVLLLVVAAHALAVLLEDREVAVRALEASEGRLMTVLDAIPELVLRVSDQGRILERLGARDAFPAGEGPDPSTLEALFGDAAEDVRAVVQAVLLDEQSRGVQSRLVTESGQRWLEVRASPLEERVDEGAKSALLTVRDVTLERRGLAREAESEKTRALRQLTGGVAHDFNNLLTAIIGNLDLVRADIHDRDQIASLDDVARAAHRGRDLTHRLLAYSERQPLQPRPLDLAETLPELLDGVRAPRVRLQVDPTWAEGAAVILDPERLRAALKSLLDNALEASQATSLPVVVRLERRLTRDEGGVRSHAAVVVEDRGEGMDAETMARACDPFFSTRGMSHTGLGLSMVRGFARQSGGDLELEPTPGGGTRVTLLLPSFEVDGPASVGGLDLEPALLVIAADRDPDIRRLVGRHVAKRGYVPVEAATVSELRAMLERFDRVALVVTELDLSGPNSGLLAVEEVPEQPVVLMVEREPVAGPIPVLRKPFAPGELSAVLARTLPARPTTPLPEVDATGVPASSLFIELPS